MQTLLSQTLENYSFLNDEVIISSILKKIDTDKDIKLDSIRENLHYYTRYIELSHVLYTLSKLEANITLIDHALKDKDDDFLYHLRMVNMENQKLLNTIFTMLDDRELKEIKTP